MSAATDGFSAIIRLLVIGRVELRGFRPGAANCAGSVAMREEREIVPKVS